MHPTNCLNCGTLLTADDNYCPTCGQKSDTHRISMSHIWHDLVHAFTHADKGMLFTIRELAVRPGTVAREYIQGKHKKYYNPFSLLVIIVGIYIFANSVFKPFSQDMFTPTPTTTIQANDSKRAKFEKMIERKKKMGEFMNHHTNIVLFVSTPFLAFIFWLFYRKRYNYAENLVTMAYVNIFLSVLTIVVFAPLLYYVPVSLKLAVYLIMMLTHVLYIGYMYYGLLEYNTGKGYFKTFGASLVAILAWGIFSSMIGFIYIFAGVM